MGIRDPRPCRSYAGGHVVHPIQAKRGLRDPGSKVAATVGGIDDTTIIVAISDESHQFVNHDLDRARDLLAYNGPEVFVQRPWSLLWFGTYLVSIRPAVEGPLDPCPIDGPTVNGFLMRPGHETNNESERST